MSNLMKFQENNSSEKDKPEEEKDQLRFDTIESVKRESESEFVPDYNIKKERQESINVSIFNKKTNKTEKTSGIINNNNSLFLEENINQSIMSFQDLPLNNNCAVNNQNANSNSFYNNNPLQKNSKINCNDFNIIMIEPYLEVEDAGEKKDL